MPNLAINPRLLLALVLGSILCSPVLADELGTTASEPNSQTAATDSAQAMPKLEGSVSISVPVTLSTCLSELMDAAQRNNTDFQKYDQAIAKYGSLGRRVTARTADALNYTLMFQGIAPSCEGGDIILGEKNKLKSLASAKYLKQKLSDELRLQLTSNVMQLAMVLGNANEAEMVQQLAAAEEELVKLVGKEQTEKTVNYLKSLKEQENAQPRRSAAPSWSVAQLQKRIQTAAESAAAADPIVKEIEDDVHHFNRHSNKVLFAHRLVRVCLSAASLSPSMIGPAAQGLLFGFLAVSGGTEQDKLLKELYLDKRLVSRSRVLTEEAHLAFENYELGALSNNRLLMACTEQLVSKMTQPTTASKLLSAEEIADTQQTH